MKTVKQWLDEEWEENGGYATKKSILKNCFDKIGSYETYADIEGLYMAVHSYWEHNVEHLSICENAKFYGIEITVDGERAQRLKDLYGKETIQLIVPQWVMSKEVKDENHAKNLFSKMMKQV